MFENETRVLVILPREVVAESRERFPSIGAAVAHGAKRLAAMNVVDHSQPVNWRRSTSHLRRR